MSDFLEKASKIIPFLSIIILLSSIIKYYTFYFNFGININEYTELSEFPLLFINDLFFYLVFIISFIFYFPFVYLRIYIRQKFNSNIFTFSVTKYFTKFSLPVIILIILNICFKDIPLDIKLNSIETYIVTFFALLLIYLDKDITYSKNYFFIITIFLMLSFSMLNAFSEISKIERGKISHQISFTSDNKEIKTTSTQIYLGKTKNFIFIYNNKIKETIVYKFDEIKDFKIRKL
ncbi:hypothetical protein [Chryseobacterium lactis]|uniref:hypothetical protein n=1 Tax=Chryseobacterium lactis TaxID=1241981 RepID=UPI001629C568|nr:hypothetical protein [Chryseobacterium lactis]